MYMNQDPSGCNGLMICQYILENIVSVNCVSFVVSLTTIQFQPVIL